MDTPDPDDPDQSHKAFDARRRTRSQSERRITPSPARTERGRPGASIRGGGPAKSPQMQGKAFGMPVPVDAEDMADGPEDEDGQVSENMLTRLRHSAKGVPASWKDEIQDVEVGLELQGQYDSACTAYTDAWGH